MNKIFVLFALFSILTIQLLSQNITRENAPDKYKWDLSQIYKDKAQWKQAKEGIAKNIPVLASYKGHLGDSAQKFYEALRLFADTDKELSRLLSYASMLFDENTKIAENQELLQEGETLATEYVTAISYIRPEILSLDKEKIDGFFKEEPKLAEFKMFVDNIIRLKAHTLSQVEERIMAKTFGDMGGAAESIYSIFVDGEMPFPEITLSTGEKVQLSNAAYTQYRTSPVREDRDLVFKEFWGAYSKFNLTFGTSLYSHLKMHVCSKDLRKYDSCLEASLSSNNIPTAVYKQLISDVHDNLGTLHRYLKLRQKMMGVEKLRYEDLYASIIPDVDLKYSADDAIKIVTECVKPLGPDYVNTMKFGFENRWVDFYPGPGKRSGAYSNGSVYDVHPYQLLNFNGTYEDVSTLAHEFGHSMHSYLSNKNQPYINSDYSIFVAEVASTLNENLLLDYMLKNTKDDNVKLFLLGSALDDLRQTLFRQTLFAEFELKIHELAEKGEPLSGETFSKIYLDLLKTYYGHDKGICEINDLYANEWSYIHHFYYNFYVYQYATSKVASSYLSKKILEEAAMKKPVTKTRDAYIKMLSSGSSKYPIDLLKDAGVDMTTSAPFKAAMEEMNKIMDQIEAILAKQQKK
ncbi:MAG: oligoendopeptidase F [Thermoanaerobaculaceae bacterium]|nr:oligoendopeptidase F [Thermoanaerobaculaceae bacterium]